MSDKPISRQRKWQLKKKAEGKCIICGKPRVNSHYCEEHRQKEREYRTKTYLKHHPQGRIKKVGSISVKVPEPIKNLHVGDRVRYLHQVSLGDSIYPKYLVSTGTISHTEVVDKQKVYIIDGNLTIHKDAVVRVMRKGWKKK